MMKHSARSTLTSSFPKEDTNGLPAAFLGVHVSRPSACGTLKMHVDQRAEVIRHAVTRPGRS